MILEALLGLTRVLGAAGCGCSTNFAINFRSNKKLMAQRRLGFPLTRNERITSIN